MLVLFLSVTLYVKLLPKESLANPNLVAEFYPRKYVLSNFSSSRAGNSPPSL